MPFYETMFIARQDMAPAQVEELANAFAKILTDNGGKVEKINHWGLKSLAYKINKNRKGHYVVMLSDTPAPALHEMERLMRLSEDVLRYMSLNVETLDMDDSSNDEEKEAA